MTLTDAIIDSLDQRPEEWVCGVDELQHGRGQTLFVGRGWLWLMIIAPARIRFSLRSKYRIWRAYRRWLHKRAASSLSQETKCPT